MPTISAYVFDLDGTLIDSEILWVEAAHMLLRDYGYDVSFEEALRIVYGRAWENIYTLIKEEYPRLRMPVATLQREFEERFAPLRDSRDIRIRGSVALLKRLATTHPVGIVSGSYVKDIAHAVALLGIEDIIAFYVGFEHVPAGKPDPACYRMAAEKFGLPPETCCAFEDSTPGIHAAKDAGLYCVALARPDRPAQDVSRADLVLDDLAKFTPEQLG
ncbi:MAG TPA: HAD family phosphatase [Candidatus Hydrogenedentes bacterium]|nr:HAD family phosphatase [Candidatus Hydrogenedentota bacterium]HNT87758.1 HAD family phosphatase [Candidatus Hydrogenedentota bacterium]